MDETRKTFASFLAEQRKGALHGELTDALAELAQAVAEHGKPGTLTLQVKLTPNADGSTVMVTDKATLKAPEAERGAAIFFVDEHGNLTRHNPAQPELPLRDAREEAR